MLAMANVQAADYNRAGVHRSHNGAVDVSARQNVDLSQNQTATGGAGGSGGQGGSGGNSWADAMGGTGGNSDATPSVKQTPTAGATASVMKTTTRKPTRNMSRGLMRLPWLPVAIASAVLLLVVPILLWVSVWARLTLMRTAMPAMTLPCCGRWAGRRRQ